MKKIIFGVVVILFVVTIWWWYFAPFDYYEYDALSANECLAGELYDEEYQVCYFDFYCEIASECAVVDDQYGAVLEALADEYVVADVEHVPYGNVIAEKTSAPISIEESVVTPPLSQKVPAKEIKKVLVAKTKQPTVSELMSLLLPPLYRAQIVDITAESDGEESTLAYVEPIDTKGAKWKMAYDPVDTYNAEKKYKNIDELLTTLVHEYAHVLTLNNSQVNYAGSDVEYIECEFTETILNEGCASSTSYITIFVSKYWTEEDRDDAFRALENNDEEDFAYELFTDQPNDFVTEYAATNAVEDIAESFALFVLKPKPTTNTIASQKIVFFYSYPELISLRNYMRGGVVKTLEAVK